MYSFIPKVTSWSKIVAGAPDISSKCPQERGESLILLVFPGWCPYHVCVFPIGQNLSHGHSLFQVVGNGGNIYAGQPYVQLKKIQILFSKKNIRMGILESSSALCHGHERTLDDFHQTEYSEFRKLHGPNSVNHHFFVNKVLWNTAMPSCLHIACGCLSRAVVRIEPVWPTNPTTFTIWPFIEKVSWSLL